MIAAILRAHWLSMRRAFAKGIALAVLGGVFWYGLWSIAALGAFSYIAYAPAAKLAGVLSLVLLGVFLYWQLMPVVSATMGASLDLRKLLAYPIPVPRLFFVELLLRLISGLEMILVLTAAEAGLIVNPAVHRVTGAAAVLALFVTFNVLLASGVRSLLERLLTQRKIRELIVLIMGALWVLPRFLMMTGAKSGVAGRALQAAMAAGLPWSAAAHAALGQLPIASWCSLAAWTAAAAWFGRAQFQRELRFDASAALATTTESPARASFVDSSYRLLSRFLRDPLGAMVEKELRTLARSATFRNLFFMGFTFGLLVWLPMVMGRSGHHESFLEDHFLTVVSVYALTLLGQVTFWNCFAFDRSATAFWYITPQPFAMVLVAKNIASQVPVYLELTILTAISVALRVVPGWGAVGEAFAVAFTCSLYMLAMGNMTSVEYPRALNPERVSQGGSSGRFQAMLLLFYPLALLPAALAFLARYAFASETAFRVTIAAAAVVGAVVYKLTLDSAVAVAGERRERLLATLAASEGPVMT
jgi:ABC-2 type transport system permease protein